MGISCIPAIPMIITCLLQGILCDTGIPRTFYGGKFAVYVSLAMLHNLTKKRGKKVKLKEVQIKLTIELRSSLNNLRLRVVNFYLRVGVIDVQDDF